MTLRQQEKDRYHARKELEETKFKKLGRDMLISRTSRLYSPEYISAGDHSIVNDFCIRSGNVEIAEMFTSRMTAGLSGSRGISMVDFLGLAFGVTVFAQSDDCNGNAFTNPIVPMKFRKILREQIEIGHHAIIGAGSVFVPGVIFAKESAVMVTKSTGP